MKNLENKILAEINDREQNMLSYLSDRTQYAGLLCQFLTKREKLADVTDAKLTERIKKSYEKDRKKELKRLDLGQAEIESIEITVEWKKSAMYGQNPTATVRVFGKVKQAEGFFDERYFKQFIGKASGCGYDKESTAIASALNQCEPLLRLMYEVASRDENIGKKNQEIFGYGSGYGPLPYFEGGVGTSCFPKIFEAIGLTMGKVASGKSFDAWNVTKKS